MSRMDTANALDGRNSREVANIAVKPQYCKAFQDQCQHENGVEPQQKCAHLDNEGPAFTPHCFARLAKRVKLP
jgi:hypothetical protein